MAKRIRNEYCMIKYIELGKKIYDTSNPREQRRMVVFVLRSMWHDADMKKLMAFFEGNEVLRKFQLRHQFHIEQVTRCFFYNGATFKERMELVCETYRYLSNVLRPDAFMQICRHDANPRYKLWEGEFEGKPLVAELLMDAGQRKEGCLSVVLTCEENAFYQVIFWINRDKNGNEAMYIGAMQGPNLDEARDVVKRMTKWAHGYRTKNLILYMTQAVARSLGLKKIYAVSNYGYYANNHVRSDRKLKTNFGDFWLEAGGVETRDRRFYELPLVESRKTMEEVPTRKRAVYRRRFAFLDEVDAEIKATMKKALR